MKQSLRPFAFKTIFTFLNLFLLQVYLFAQESPHVEINDTDLGSWIGRNWMWVAGVVVLLLILLISGGSRRRSTTTTIHRRDDGTVTKTTTVETDA